MLKFRKSDEPYPGFFFKDQLEYLGEGKCLDPEKFPGDLKDEIQERMDKIDKMLQEFEERIGMVKATVREGKEFAFETPAGKIQDEEGDVIRVPEKLAEENDELIPYFPAS